jgi:hypothetical protein
MRDWTALRSLDLRNLSKAAAACALLALVASCGGTSGSGAVSSEPASSAPAGSASSSADPSSVSWVRLAGASLNSDSAKALCSALFGPAEQVAQRFAQPPLRLDGGGFQPKVAGFNCQYSSAAGPTGADAEDYVLFSVIAAQPAPYNTMSGPNGASATNANGSATVRVLAPIGSVNPAVAPWLSTVAERITGQAPDPK